MTEYERIMAIADAAPNPIGLLSCALATVVMCRGYADGVATNGDDYLVSVKFYDGWRKDKAKRAA